MDIKRPGKSKIKKRIRTAILLGLGLAAVAGITFGWICGGLILGILAVIFGFVALSQTKKDPAKYGGKPLAFGGLVTGGIVLLVHLAILVIWIVALVFSSLSR